MPSGQDLEGVRFEWERRHKNREDVCITSTAARYSLLTRNKAYIREIDQHDLGTIILTCRRQQAAVLTNLPTFHVELSSKRLKNGWNELLVSCYNLPHQKCMLESFKILS
jgi:hypothetical protein